MALSRGATLKMRHLDAEVDAYDYIGHQYTWIGWDELGQRPSLWGLPYAEGVPAKRCGDP
jgi:hypothetical protein